MSGCDVLTKKQKKLIFFVRNVQNIFNKFCDSNNKLLPVIVQMIKCSYAGHTLPTVGYRFKMNKPSRQDGQLISAGATCMICRWLARWTRSRSGFRSPQVVSHMWSVPWTNGTLSAPMGLPSWLTAFWLSSFLDNFLFLSYLYYI